MIADLVSLPARHLPFLVGKGPFIDTGKFRQESNNLMIFAVHPFLSDKSPGRESRYQASLGEVSCPVFPQNDERQVVRYQERRDPEGRGAFIELAISSAKAFISPCELADSRAFI